MSDLSDQIAGYIKRVKELAEHVKGNEQATKQSLIGPFFTMLGYDLTDPRECIPEYKVDFGKERSSKPIDWAFLHNGTFAFFVEAKEVGRKLGGFDEQLADYFAKDPNVKLGILTNGAQWRFFTDVVNPNVMDKEPFAKWDVFSEDPAPFDVITILLKAKLNPELVRAYAQRQREKNLLLGELTRLLEPSTEFTKLAIANIETRNLTQAVIESWKSIVASAINEWARQRMLTAALTTPTPVGRESKPDAAGGGKVEASTDELNAFATIKRLLGPDRPAAYEPSVAYFKIHIAEKRTWAFARLQLDRKHPIVWVHLPPEKATELAPGRHLGTSGLWSLVPLDSVAEIADLGGLFREAFADVKRTREEGGSFDE